jgi:outer membrane protein assembly factor BamB
MRIRSRSAWSLQLAFLLACASGAAMAQDWPQWRGPGRDGIAAPPADALSWPAKLTRKWVVPAGVGHASPIVVGDRVFLASRIGENEAVSAYDLKHGKLLWQDRYPAPYTMNPAAGNHGRGPKSTPAHSAGRLCTLGITGILSCYDSASGKRLWQKEFSARFRATSPLYGTAASPLIDGGLVIVQAGGNDSGGLLAFDVNTGSERWHWEGDGPGYASPIALVIEGVRQIVTQTQKNIVSVSAADGTLLWSIPFTTPWVQNIVTPVVAGDLLVFSGLDQGTIAVRAKQAGGRWNTTRIWTSTEDGFYMSTPVVVGGRIIGMSHKKRGEIVCLDAPTGRKIWAGPAKFGENAALIGAGRAVIALSDTAELVVLDASAPEYRAVRKYTAAESATWAHPALSGRRLLIKDVDTLALWSAD